MSNQIIFQQLFEGYQNTPQLWTGNTIWDLEQLPIELHTQRKFESNSKGKRLRLGKWVETFFSFQLNQLNTVNVLAEGIQIKRQKQTIGELDSLFIWKGQPIHTEVVYKFYLYDPQIEGETYLDHWIGPNRRDTLIYKLNKLRNKQFPLLYNANTLEVLGRLNIDPEQIRQFVHFKAKLFTPLNSNINKKAGLNPSSVAGNYIKAQDLKDFKSYLFYFPKKLEWLLNPETSVPWLHYKDAEPLILNELSNERSPLIWLKSPDGDKQLLFVVWW
jgi:hypothetical protein